MQRYIFIRLLQMIPVLLIVTFGVFAMLLLQPGDPAVALMGGGEGISRELIEQYRKDLGLDKPVPVQYGLWLGRVLRGDLGKSALTKRPVMEELRHRIPVTLQLGLSGWVIAMGIAIPAGVISARKRGSLLDNGVTTFSMGLVAMPEFWFAIIMILVFAVILGVLPVAGFVSFLDNPLQSLRHLALPAITLGTHTTAVTMRLTRSAMLEVLAQDYVRTARSKGLRERRVVLRHALPNALLPVITVSGLQLARLVAGAVIVETIFAIPGIGRLAVQSIFFRDFAMVQGIVLLVAVAVLFTNLLTDLLYAFIDPRIRYG
ncbi:MAG: ABC transporter permease [Chloroflexi bacterium]|nr:ABC transporter permease [Chloroflexota bacterium]